MATHASSSSLDPLEDGNPHPSAPLCCGGGESPQGMPRREPGTICRLREREEPETNICHLLSSFTAVEFASPRKKSLHQLFNIFKSLNIKTETSRYYANPRPASASGIFCKNLFLKDRKGRFYLVVCDEARDVDLKRLRATVRAHRNFSFASDRELDLKMALTPGAVSPFGLMNDLDRSIRVVIDRSLATEVKCRHPLLLNFHPIVDYLTTLISLGDLMKFLEFCGHSAEFVDM